MIEINLLPKDLQRKRLRFKLDKNIVLALSTCVGLLAVMLLYSYVFQAGKYSSLDKELAMARAETARYAPEIAKIDEISKKKEQILARMSSIQVLDHSREYWVSLMGDLAGRVPEYVWLTAIKQAPRAVAPAANASTGAPAPPPAAKSSIEGYSFSLNALATFLVRLKKSSYFDKVEIASIKLQELDKASAYNFKLNCDLVSEVVQNLDVQTAQAATGMEYQF